MLRVVPDLAFLIELLAKTDLTSFLANRHQILIGLVAHFLCQSSAPPLLPFGKSLIAEVTKVDRTHGLSELRDGVVRIVLKLLHQRGKGNRPIGDIKMNLRNS